MLLAEEKLRDTLARCVEHYGHVPQVAEFEWWRDRLARAQGNDALHLPTASPYRKRWRNWEGALRYFATPRTRSTVAWSRPQLAFRESARRSS